MMPSDRDCCFASTCLENPVQRCGSSGVVAYTVQVHVLLVTWLCVCCYMLLMLGGCVSSAASGLLLTGEGRAGGQSEGGHDSWQLSTG